MSTTKRLKRRRTIAYVLLTLSIGYLTYLVIADTYVENFRLGKIDFSRDEVNNYSTLIGAIVGVVGAVLLLETFWLQFKQYNDDKQEKENQDKIDKLDRLKLFSNDLKIVRDDFIVKFKNVKEYSDAEKNNPFTGHVLRRTSSGYFLRIKAIGRITLYRSFSMYVKRINSEWIKLFNDTYGILDFLEDTYTNIYQMYDEHTRDQLNRRMSIRTSLSEFMNEATHFLGFKERELGSIDIAKGNREWLIVNNVIERFMYYLRNPEIDEDGKKQTSFSTIMNEVLHPFIDNLIDHRNQSGFLSRELDLLIEKAANINREIELHRDKSIEFSDNLSDSYTYYATTSENSKSIDLQLDEIISIIDYATIEADKALKMGEK